MSKTQSVSPISTGSTVNSAVKPERNIPVLERLKTPQLLRTEDLKKNPRLELKFVRLCNAIVASLGAYPDMKRYMTSDFGDHMLGDQALLMRYMQSVPGQRCGDFVWPLTEHNVMMEQNAVIQELTFWENSVIRLKEHIIGIKKCKSDLQKDRAKQIVRLKSLFNLKLSATTLGSNVNERDWSRDSKKNVVLLALYFGLDICKYLKPATAVPRPRTSRKKRFRALTDAVLSEKSKRRNASSHKQSPTSTRTAKVTTKIKDKQECDAIKGNIVKERSDIVKDEAVLKKEFKPQTGDEHIIEQHEAVSHVSGPPPKKKQKSHLKRSAKAPQEIPANRRSSSLGSNWQGDLVLECPLTPMFTSEQTDCFSDVLTLLDTLKFPVSDTPCTTLLECSCAGIRDSTQDQRDSVMISESSGASSYSFDIPPEIVWDMDIFSSTNIRDSSSHDESFEEDGLTHRNDFVEMCHLQHFALQAPFWNKYPPESELNRPPAIDNMFCNEYPFYWTQNRVQIY